MTTFVTEILPPNPYGLDQAARALRSGQLVGMPTETVYGLAGNALSAAAVAEIFATKERPTFDPLIVHIAPGLGSERERDTNSWVERLQNLGLIDDDKMSDLQRVAVESLCSAFWPGPLTLVLPRSAQVPDLVTSGMPTVALRMPRHPLALRLIEEAGVPLAAPSANRFGRISPTQAEDVLAELSGRIPFVLDGGRCEVGVESTVLGWSEESGVPVLLRPGGLPREQIEALLDVTLAIPAPPTRENSSRGLSSPGMLASHYAPRKPLQLLPGALHQLTPEQFACVRPPPASFRLGLLAQAGTEEEARALFHSRLPGCNLVACEVLSREGNLKEAARNLFAALRALDESGADALWAEPCLTQTGLGHAISDRLNRAAGGHSSSRL